MGAPNPEVQGAIRSQRRKHRVDGEPLNETTRDAQQIRHSIYVNVTKYGVETLGIEKGDQVTVETYTDRIVIKPGNVE